MGINYRFVDPVKTLQIPSGAEPDFHSEWSTATGYSETAVRDGGKWPVMAYWTGTGTPESNGRVVSASGLGFPTGLDNVLLTTLHENPGSSGQVHVRHTDALWAVPEIGQTLFHRWYVRVDVRNAAGNWPATTSHHPFQGYLGPDGTNCTLHWGTKYGFSDDGTWSFTLSYGQNSVDPGGHNQFVLSGLTKFTPYLLEVAYTRVGTNSYAVVPRINGVDRTDDFNNFFNTVEAFTIGDVCLQTLFVGNNDPGWSDSTLDPTQDFMHWGAVAVAVRDSADDWIGAYDDARGW